MVDPSFKKIIDEEVAKRHREENELVVTLESGKKIPFRDWAHHWVATNIDGHKPMHGC